MRLGIHGSVLGEVVTFGGLGTGLYSIVMIALVAAFLGGLRVGPAGVPGKRIIAAGAPLTVFIRPVDASAGVERRSTCHERAPSLVTDHIDRFP